MEGMDAGQRLHTQEVPSSSLGVPTIKINNL